LSSWALGCWCGTSCSGLFAGWGLLAWLGQLYIDFSPVNVLLVHLSGSFLGIFDSFELNEAVS